MDEKNNLIDFFSLSSLHYFLSPNFPTWPSFLFPSTWFPSPAWAPKGFIAFQKTIGIFISKYKRTPPPNSNLNNGRRLKGYFKIWEFWLKFWECNRISLQMRTRFKHDGLLFKKLCPQNIWEIFNRLSFLATFEKDNLALVVH